MPLACAGLLLLGCQKQAPPSNATPAQQNTPKSKLSWVAKRLEHAFELGQPSRLAGIRVEHTMSYQFREPSDQQRDYQATVVIRTRTENVLAPNRNRVGSSEQISGANQVSEAAPKTSVNRQESMRGTPEASADTSSIDTHSIHERQSFELVYRNDRWQLVSELEVDPERLWFQYALQ